MGDWCRIYVARMANDRVGHRCDFSLRVRISIVPVFFGRRRVQEIEKENGRTADVNSGAIEITAGLLSQAHMSQWDPAQR